MVRLPSFAVPLFVLAGFLVKALGTILLVYIGARLAIRHERRLSN